MKNIFKFLITFFLFVNVAFGATRYVRCTTGSDSNDGNSLPTAYLTIQKCVDVSSSGDTCLISDNEVCTAGWSTETGFTKNDYDKTFTVSGANDGGNAKITFPDNRPEIEHVAVLDFSSITTQFGGLNARDISFIYKNLKITIPNHQYGMHSGGYPIWKDVEINDNGLSGERNFLYMQYYQNTFENVFFKKDNTTGFILYNDGNGGVQQNFRNSYFRWGQFNYPIDIGKYANSSPCGFEGNVFEVTNTVSTTYPMIVVHGGVYNQIKNNTFLGNGLPNLKAMKIYEQGYGQPISAIKDNIFYEFDGAGATSITWNSGVDFNIVDYGNNAFFNSTTPEVTPASATIINNLTSSDVILDETPFTDIVNGDLTLLPEYRGTSSLDKDIGAVQSQTSGGGGGGSTLFIPIGE